MAILLCKVIRGEESSEEPPSAAHLNKQQELPLFFSWQPFRANAGVGGEE